jgi:hypothetical protein
MARRRQGIPAKRKEKPMLRYAVILSALMGALLAVPQVMAQGIVEGFRTCPGDYALCDASTCTATGEMIEVNTVTGTALFDEAECTCPIFPGPALGDVSGGNMGLPLGPGNCTPPTAGMPPTVGMGDDGIWSLFSLETNIPQEINNWSKGKKQTATSFLTCDAPDTTFANCFSFACVRAGKIRGVEVATCFCAIGESLRGTGVPLGTPFETKAGQGNMDICSQLPVAAAIPDGSP